MPRRPALTGHGGPLNLGIVHQDVNSALRRQRLRSHANRLRLSYIHDLHFHPFQSLIGALLIPSHHACPTPLQFGKMAAPLPRAAPVTKAIWPTNASGVLASFALII